MVIFRGSVGIAPTRMKVLEKDVEEDPIEEEIPGFVEDLAAEEETVTVAVAL